MQNDQEKKSGLARLGYIWNDWISTFIILALLLMTLLIGTGEMIHGQMLRMGERFTVIKNWNAVFVFTS
jgi:hypothetical protein